MYQITSRGMDTDIYLTRGDTFSANIAIYDADGKAYVPDVGDTITFAMKANYSDEDPAVEVDIDPDTMLLVIESGDTAGLPMGVAYVYDIQLTSAGGDVYTFIKGRFFLGEEVAP